MAKPQPWPLQTLDHATVILSQNDMLLLALYVCYFELKDRDNLQMVDGLMPIITERTAAVYEAAVQLGPCIENRPSDKLPLWAKQASRIVKEYPAVLLRLKEIEVKIRQQRVIEICWMLVELFMILASIQKELLKIAVDKKTILFLPVKKINEMSKNLTDDNNGETPNGSIKLDISRGRREQRDY